MRLTWFPTKAAPTGAGLRRRVRGSFCPWSLVESMVEEVQ
jgi:hypothetical protein